ncbi:prepilin peptidase [Ramlibacter sp. USB13]|uniref:Protein translocase subunit SecA n=1 Tax=Ramlibacter cellulosilyticus TaxID=2764187 RepID=A0A923SDI8_9BURK|nr:prepilin peptidase [Ramlibacter cellulosilyticus]MBC5785964.1 prepilin peptidase [Ramlibacter cellulosilyticus]
MTQLAWAHLPASLYAERTAPAREGVDAWLRGAVGDLPQRLARGLRWHRTIAQAAEELAASVAALDDATLRDDLRRSARASWSDATGRYRVLALVREAAVRSLGKRAYGAQLVGASCLVQGQMAEMQTGEGKTLTAGLAAAAAACAGQPVHVITVNDYLTQRDAEELSPLFDFLGLTCGHIVTGMSADERRHAYRQQVTYCTGKELVFDYLKDRAAHGAGVSQADLRLRRATGEATAPTLLRGLFFGIVDEADSVLIDEARTPLILSQNAGASPEPRLLQQALELIEEMAAGVHYELHEGRRELHLLPAGRMWLTERCVALGREWSIRHVREHWTVQALRARHLFHRNEHYVLKDGKVVIVDENTGRAMPGRTWEQGLHQLIEVREGCELSDEARTVARITYQRFFRRFLRLSGMTGTAAEVRRELWRDYGLCTVVVPPNVPCVRRTWRAACLPHEDAKWNAVARSTREVVEQGRPVLIGTRSVAASETLSAVLAAQGIPHEVLNAVQDAHEARLVAAAGQPGRVTVATNMAGRGTDIRLHDAVRERGGLHVILTEFHDSRRVDRQLFGRTARQGDPGTAQAIVSVADRLFAQQEGPVFALMLRALGSWPALALLVLECTRRRAQSLTERLHERTRKGAVRHDEHLETSLSYSGRA